MHGFMERPMGERSERLFLYVRSGGRSRGETYGDLPPPSKLHLDNVTLLRLFSRKDGPALYPSYQVHLESNSAWDVFITSGHWPNSLRHFLRTFQRAISSCVLEASKDMEAPHFSSSKIHLNPLSSKTLEVLKFEP